MIHVGLPKGNFVNKSLNLIQNYLQTDLQKDKLYFTDDKNVSFYLLKFRDIPKMIDNGILDVGITTTEWLIENNLPLQEVSKLDWFKGRISLLSKNPCLSNISDKKPIRCITEYPKIAEGFFLSEKVTNYIVYAISGSTEGLVPKLFDCSIDCVETGKTAKLHKLKEEKKLFETYTTLVIKRTNNVNAYKPTLEKLGFK